MKKTYIAPENIVVAVNNQTTLLAGSVPVQVLNSTDEFDSGSDEVGARELLEFDSKF